MRYDFVIANNAPSPFCAVVDAATGETVEQRAWSPEAEAWAEQRTGALNVGAEAPPQGAYDVAVDMTLNMVVRGAASQEEAREIGRQLAQRVFEVNECLNGADYQQPKVTEFTINTTGGDIAVFVVDEG